MLLQDRAQGWHPLASHPITLGEAVISMSEHEYEAPSPQSGYTHCACRDCMDTAISSDTTNLELCGECQEAGCTVYDRRDTTQGLNYECQRDDAYSDDVADAGTGHGAYEYRSGA